MIDKISDPPRFTNNDIESFIKDKYGIDADIRPLVGDIGQNFLLIDRQGKE